MKQELNIRNLLFIKRSSFLFVLLFLGIVQFSESTRAQCAVFPPVPQDACYNIVIANDPFCCNTAWDAICQNAYDNCVPPPPPPPGTINMTNGSSSTCTGTFYDSGGAAGNYGNSQFFTYTICSSVPGNPVQLNFTSFSIENNFDFLTIYNGPSTASPLIGTYTGTGSPGLVTASGDCLTLVFTSDGIISGLGWAATITCVTPPPPPCGTPTTFNFTGGIQNFVVPAGVTSLVVVVEGAQGGGAGGANGATVTGSINVTPGQNLQIVVGGQGGCPGAGYGGGGAGQNSNIAGYQGCGGGGASYISAPPGGMTNALIVAAGGGGEGGGDDFGVGGVGGCGSGGNGSSPFGIGGGGATVSSGGVGGPPWTVGGGPGQNGSFGQGGAGGVDINYGNAPGGGGGGGYYGGGGGGSDNISSTSFIGGGGGGGGSSLVPLGGGCTQGNSTGNGSITIYVPTPNVMTSPNTATICSGGTVNIPLTSTIAGSTFQWIATDNPNVTGESLTTQTTSTLNNTLTNTTTAVQTVTYTVTPYQGACIGTPQTVTVTINPPPVITAEPDLTFCAGAAVPANTFASTPAGATFTWTNSNTAIGLAASGATSVPGFTATNGTAAAITSTITVTPTLGTCVGPTEVYTITVNPLPVITAEPDLTFCAGAAVPANTFASTPAGATFTWTNSNTAIGLAASGVTSVPGFTATNGTAAAITSTITVTPTLGTCVGPTEVYTITVNPLPVITAEPDLTFCAGAAVPANTFASTPAGATFTWTNSNTAIGLAASGVTSVPGFTATNGTAAAITSTITVTPTLGTCVGPTEVYTITVNPLPVITAEPDLTFCAGAAVPANTFASTPAGATFTWTNSNTAIGLVASGVTSVPGFTATNGTAAAITSTITVTPTLGTCVGPTEVYTITVNPLPVITAEPDLTFCAGAAVPANTFASTPAGATFTWTNSNTAIGLAASGVTSVPGFTATNGTAAAITSTITVTPTLGTCVGPTEVYTITVNPLPVITAEPDLTFCAGVAVPANTFASTPAGATFTWTNSNTAIGLAASGATSVPGFTATNGTAAAITSTITVTPTLGTCVGPTEVYTITINPTPTVTDPADQVICAGGSTTAVNFTGTAGTTFNWTNNNTSIGLGASGTGNIGSFTAVNGGGAAVTATITVTPVLGPCTGTPQTFTITVNPNPIIAVAGVNPTICAGTDGTITITGLAASTNYTVSYTDDGSAVGPVALTSNGAGAITITGLNAGSYTNFVVANGPCLSTSATVIVLVDPNPPVVNDPADQTLCANTATTAVNFTGTAGATFNWTNNNTAIGLVASGTGNIASFPATNATSLPITATITVTPTLAGCTGTAQTFTITVNPTPTVTDPADQVICAGGSTTAVNFTGTAGTTFNWTNNNTSIGLGASGTGNIGSFTAVNGGGAAVTATITVTPVLGPCTGTPQTFTITVNPNPIIAVAGVNPTICAGTDGTITITGLAASTNYTVSYTDDGSAVGPVALTSNGAGAITITGLNAGSYTNFVVANGPCLSTSATVIVLVDPNPPVVNDPADQTLCANTATTAVNFTGTAGATFNWTNDTPSIGLAAGGTGNIASFPATNAGTTPVVATITVTPTLAGCTGTAQTFTITVNPIPTVTDPADQSLCANASTTAVNFTGTVGATFNWTNNTPSIGLAASGTGNIAAFTALNGTPGTTVVATITVTPTLNGCNGTPQTFTITVINTLPTLTPPANLTAVCSITEQPAYANFAAFTGAGGSASSVGGTINAATFTLVSEVSDGLSCPETVTRTYSIQDNCGNTATCTQLIVIDDNINPTASNPAGITAQCIGDVPAPDPTVVIDEADNCTASVPVVAFVSDVSDGNACPETITRTYSVTDACGNTINVTQTIVVDDTTNPTASNPANIIVPGGPAPAPDPLVVTTEADNCSVPVVAFVSDVSDGNSCPETITRTYSVTDACGNQITVTQLILITDPINPTASNPAAINVQCLAQVPAPDPTVVTDEADNNGAPTVAFVSDVSDGNTCPETITRTYSVTDPCGNVINVTQTITVDDTTNPTATAPANVTVQCIADVPAADPTLITDEADNCSVPVVAFVGDVSDGNTCPETITRTYSITDACGNVINVTQTITVDDTTNPTATAPANVTVQCIADVPAADPTLITDEADNCSVPVVAFVSDVSDGNACPETITRTYSVTDACGNTINVTQTIIVDDTTNPTASNPANIIVPGGPAPAPDPLVVIDEADNCSVPVVAFVSDVSDGNACPETITRTYSVTDACGNQITVTQLILITDPINPTASNPAAINVQCVAQVPAPDPTVVTDEADNNGAPTVAFVSDVSDGLTCPETITRTYSVTDPCGNVINVTQTIVVDDTTNPTATAPANVTVQCIAQVPAADPTLITDEADNCSLPVVAFVSDVSDGNTCPETITRTYSVTDACGNVINVTQTITVDDTTNPTATAPANVTVQCIADVPAADPTLITDEADNCSVPVVAFVSDVSNGLTCPETITRTYSVTDACGNTINVTQTIIVDDTTNPTASNPANIIVPGGPSPAPDPLVVIDEADNCSVPVVAFVSDVSDGNACPETITRTYSVTDACGNQITVTQLILITDPINPTASNPAAINVQCVAQVPAPDPTVVTDEADNNGVPVVAFVSDVSDGLTCPETITRTYSVTDPCGNQITVTQTIIVDDTTNPTATNPIGITVQCIGDVPAADVTVVTDEADNCTVNPVVAFVSDVSDGLTCPETITRTYSVTDDCGNQITVTQTIVVDDTTNPTASNPAGVTVQCIGDVPAANTAVVIDEADNCSVPVVAFVSDVSDGNTCPETITRTYSVTDACGNTINVTQTIIVDDTTNPTASNPAGVTVDVIANVPAPDPLVVIDEADNCSVPVVAFVSDVSDGLNCPETITRSYSVTDACGNQITVTQTIIVSDIILPTASNPATVNVQCIGDVPAPDPTVVIDEADNNGVPTVAFVSDVSDGLTCPETITRTYSVTDPCANVITVTQTIVVDDTTNPTATNPVGITVQCIGDVPAADVTVVTDEADNCTVNPVVAFVSDVSDGLTCPETITRSYSVTDDCGNQITVTQTIVVDDTTNPTASNPAGVTVQCIGDVPAADPTVVIDEADNCSVPVVVFVSDVSDGNTCPETITRTYSVTDACGNTINVTQTIVVDDTTNPTASNPAGVTVDVIANVPAPDPLVVIDEADNCSVPVVAFVSDVSDGNACPETITRTYSVTDACGNTINVTQTIIVSDLQFPTASNPAGVSVQCIAQVPVPDPTVVIDEADNNGVPTVVFVSDVSNGLTCPETITRTYSVTDACNNQITVTQTIIVDDTTNPTASNPVGVTVQCIGQVPAPDITVVTDEADNCTVNPVVAFVSDVSNGLTCPETITRTYSVTDDCGNQITVTQTIVVDDTTNPTASNPAGVTVQCIGDVPAANTAVVTDEADNCSVPVVAFVSDVSDGNTCPQTITRTYSVTDACGNSINVTQTIIVDDTTNPTASNPAPINVSCASNVPAPNIAVVTDEADNCTAAPIVAWVSDVSDNNTCNGEIITRTYSVTDNCGNSITVTQQITIDVVTPVVNAGSDQAVCDGVQVTLTATNPNGAVITWDNGVTNGSPFNSPVGTTTYTVTATQCGGECFATDQVDVTVYPLPSVIFEGDVLLGCDPFTVNFTNLTVPAGASCNWNYGDGSTGLGCDSSTHTYLSAGVYDVSLTVTSNEGCTSSTTYNDYITVIPQPVAEFTANPEAVDVNNPEIDFINSSQNADDYYWDFNDGTFSLQTDPTHMFPQIGNMTYEVMLIASNYAGCADTAYVEVEVQDVLLFYVPNVFTPDGNDINNTFYPVFTAGFDPYDYHLMIFNRWGEVLFESYDATVGWSGTYGDQGLVQDDVYVWQIEFGDNKSDKRHRHRGHVTVLK
jgi:gliding motility-associated-like protein